MISFKGSETNILTVISSEKHHMYYKILYEDLIKYQYLPLNLSRLSVGMHM